MNKSVVLNLGKGNLYDGFSVVTAQLWTAEHPYPEQFIGSLPSAPYLVEMYRNWQSIYQSLCDRVSVRRNIRLDDLSIIEDDELEIDTEGITNISVTNFDDVCITLQSGINQWLKSVEFLNIERQLRTKLNCEEEIRVIIETQDDLLRRLPWHRWDFFEDYPKAEIGLSRPEYKRTDFQRTKSSTNKVRILAILGNCQGIDLNQETEFLQTLPDAEIAFIVNPTRQELNIYLWDNDGWDILFFGGHSQTEGETGRIFINENQTNNNLTLEQLQEALKAAISKGLKLAIFNSCDGLGLANALEKLNIPTVIVMREPVPNLVAQVFFNHFLQAFAVNRLGLYQAVQQARRKLQGLEDDFPGASWLPVICQNPAVQPPTWLQFGAIPPCPYRGLFAFQEKDADLFFGRDQYTKNLLTAVKKQPLVAVIAASGSGKSSVVFAGLLPQLRQDKSFNWEIVSFRPGKNPFTALATALAKVLPMAPYDLEVGLQKDQSFLYKNIETFIQQNPGTRLVIIADQFEELYTLASFEVKDFLYTLLQAVQLAPGFTLVITLRADFYGHALSCREFSDALQQAILNLGPMNPEELRQGIEQPAAQMQVGFEPELINKLIADVSGLGSLPLLQFALTQLWTKQKNEDWQSKRWEELSVEERSFIALSSTLRQREINKFKRRRQAVISGLIAGLIFALSLLGLSWWQWQNSVINEIKAIAASSEALLTSNHEFDALIESLQASTKINQANFELNGFQQKSILRSNINDLLQEAVYKVREYNRLEKHTNDVADVQFSPKGNIIATASYDNTAKLWNSDGKELVTLVGHQQKLTSVAFSPRDDIVATASYDKTVKLWNYSGKLLKTLSGYSNGVNSVAFNFTGNIIVTGDADGWVKIWTSTGELVKSFKAHNLQILKVIFSPDGQTIATASEDHTVKVWNINGEYIKILLTADDWIRSIAFSPDGHTLASGSLDMTVKLWDVATAKEIRTFKGHNTEVASVSFNPDGHTLASADAAGKLIIWYLDLQPKDIMARGCSWVHNYLQYNHHGDDEALCK